MKNFPSGLYEFPNGEEPFSNGLLIIIDQVYFRMNEVNRIGIYG